MGIPLKNIAYNLVIADSYQIIELKTSSDQWKLFKGDDVDSIFVTDCLFTSPSSKPFTHFES